jgi:two-component system cell cycle response regulator DivK
MEDFLKDKIIVVVEDDPISMDFLQESLKLKGADVVMFRSGEEAITYFEAEKPVNLVLMDIRLPGMNGYETTKKLRSIRSDVPIIAETAYALDGDEDKAIKAGCIDYISKPIKPQQLFDIIAKYV